MYHCYQWFSFTDVRKAESPAPGFHFHYNPCDLILFKANLIYIGQEPQRDFCMTTLNITVTQASGLG